MSNSQRERWITVNENDIVQNVRILDPTNPVYETSKASAIRDGFFKVDIFIDPYDKYIDGVRIPYDTWNPNPDPTNPELPSENPVDPYPPELNPPQLREYDPTYEDKLLVELLNNNVEIPCDFSTNFYHQIKKLKEHGELTDKQLDNALARKHLTLDEYKTICTDETLQLEGYRQARIIESKIKLADYLEKNPYLHTDGEYYTCTKERQMLLNNLISTAKMEVESGNTEYEIKWNPRGRGARVYTMEEICALNIGMQKYVSRLLIIQQSFEASFMMFETLEEIKSITIDYSKI